MSKKGTNANCPVCGRVLDFELDDEIHEYKGLVYHDECMPVKEPVVEPVVESVVEPTVESVVEPIVPEKKGKKGKKMAKKTPQDELMEKLLSIVSQLSAEVVALKARPVATPASAPTSKKTKSLKGAPRPELYYVFKTYPADKQPPQCLKVMKALAQACPENCKMTELDIWNALMAEPFPSLKPHARVACMGWNYNQDPFYIFRYYKLRMVEAEHILGPFSV